MWWSEKWINSEVIYMLLWSDSNNTPYVNFYSILISTNLNLCTTFLSEPSSTIFSFFIPLFELLNNYCGVFITMMLLLGVMEKWPQFWNGKTTSMVKWWNWFHGEMMKQPKWRKGKTITIEKWWNIFNGFMLKWLQWWNGETLLMVQYEDLLTSIIILWCKTNITSLIHKKA